MKRKSSGCGDFAIKAQRWRLQFGAGVGQLDVGVPEFKLELEAEEGHKLLWV